MIVSQRFYIKDQTHLNLHAHSILDTGLNQHLKEILHPKVIRIALY